MMKDGHSHGEFGLEREPSHLPRLHLYYYGMMLVHRIAGCEYSHALTVHVLCCVCARCHDIAVSGATSSCRNRRSPSLRLRLSV